MIGIREIRHGNREDPGRLGRVDGADRARGAPPAEDRGHDELADRDVEPGQHPEELDPGRIQAGFLLGLAQGGAQRAGGLRIAVLRVQGAAGEGGLARVRAEAAGALLEQQFRAAGALAEEDEDGGLAAPAVLGGAGSGSAASA
ncbi:hypothetical protein GCM10020254_40830 [Streptomyces goshikiensis]